MDYRASSDPTRAQIVGSTPHPDEMFMRQVGRTLTAADDEESLRHRVPICELDPKWSAAVRQFLADAEVRVVQTPFQIGPTCTDDHFWS